MSVIGIDLGTTYSCVAVLQHGKVEIIANEQGGRTTPSCVSFTDNERLIGEAAKDQMTRNIENTVFDCKRIIGRAYDDPALKNDMRQWPFKVVNRDGKPKIQVLYKRQCKEFYPEEISAMMLSKMKKIAEAYLGEPVSEAVVTVPAHFNDAQRTATKDAARIAGLTILRMINEPTAAAIAYGLNEKESSKRNILIFDLGGGTFDVSVLTIEKGNIDIKATAGDTHLGGEDFNDRLINYFAAEFGTQHKVDIRSDKKAIARLRVECEKAKRALSASTQASLYIDSLHKGIDFNGHITRAKFDQINEDLFKGTLETVDFALNDASVNKDKIDKVVLVGGSTRIVKIQNILAEYFGEEKIHKTINPDEAVAHGAAVQAVILSGTAPTEICDIVLQDVTPLSLGIEIVGNIMSCIVKRNTSIPSTTWGRDFTTVRDNQESVEILVYEGERAMTNENHLLGSFVLHGILPAPSGVPRIDVCFDIGADGILNVSAHDKSTGKKEEITITQDRGRLSSEEIQRLIDEAEQHELDDEKWKKTRMSMNELEALVHRVENGMQRLRVRGGTAESEMQGLSEKAAKVQRWIMENQNASMNDIRSKHSELEEASHSIFGRVYNENM